jgi:hypothetical protein
MQDTPPPAPRNDETCRATGAMAASPHLLDALEALSAMKALENGAEPSVPLFNPPPCTTTTTTSASATTCKP